MRRLLLLSVAMLLSACASLLPQGQEAPRLFVLNVPRTTAPPDAAPLPFTLRITLPQAVPGLDSERIALRKGGSEMDYFADARWAGPILLIVQSQLIESFENAHAFKSVGNEATLFNPDMLMTVEIRDFQAEYGVDAVPLAHVRLVVRLMQRGKHAIIFTRAYEETEPAGANRMQEVVSAYNTAFARACAHMVADVTRALDAFSRHKATKQ